MDIYSQAADGSGPASAVFSAPGNQWAMALSRDGSRLLVIENYKDVSLLPVDAPSRMEPLLHSQSREWLAEVSPDGNWLAYESDEANNRMEIVLRPFPNVTASREVVSVAGGRYPFWSPSGRDELYYVDPAGAMMAVPIVTSPRLRIGQPRKLFTMDKPSEGVSGRPYDVSPTDGRFVVTKSTAAAATVNLSVTLNWFQELTK